MRGASTRTNAVPRVGFELAWRVKGESEASATHDLPATTTTHEPADGPPVCRRLLTAKRKNVIWQRGAAPMANGHRQPAD